MAQGQSSESTPYASGAYWRERTDLLYYSYVRFIVRCVGRDAQSILDVGTGSCPYLEWFHWIPEKWSIDIRAPYSSDTVQSIVGNVRDVEFGRKFDICTCLQVLEHVQDVEPFARRLLEVARLVVVSVPYKWPAGTTKGHKNDPVSLSDLHRWFGRIDNYHLIVEEPFVEVKSKRLIAIYDVEDENRKFGLEARNNRRPELPSKTPWKTFYKDLMKRGFARRSKRAVDQLKK
jgi:hypothetical protein